MSTRRAQPTKSQALTEKKDFSVEEILSRKDSNEGDVKEIMREGARISLEGASAGSKQTLEGINAANEDKKKYKIILLYACMILWLCCEAICLVFIFIASDSVGENIKSLAATAAIQTLPSIAFGFIAGKSTE
jgi:hypothetical protein